MSSLPSLDRPLGATGRLLIVDDNPGACSPLLTELERRGHQVSYAGCGEEAIEVVSASCPDLLVLDVLLPGITGIEVCRRLRQDWSALELPIVLISAMSDVESRLRGRASGADDYIARPFDPGELALRIETLLALCAIHSDAALSSQVLPALDDHDAMHQRLNAALAAEQGAWQEAIRRIAFAADLRDDETAQHVLRVGESAGLLAERLGLPVARVNMLRVASRMHDVGKIGVPDDILRKPGKLEPEEWSIMKLHAEIGHRLLSGTGNETLELAAQVAWEHHERWDGRGYPRGLRGDEIGIEAQIVAVADVFDALTSERVYKAAWRQDRAVELIRSERGRQFAPRVVDAFLELCAEIQDLRVRYPDLEGLLADDARDAG